MGLYLALRLSGGPGCFTTDRKQIGQTRLSAYGFCCCLPYLLREAVSFLCVAGDFHQYPEWVYQTFYCGSAGYGKDSWIWRIPRFKSDMHVCAWRSGCVYSRGYFVAASSEEKVLSVEWAYLTVFASPVVTAFMVAFTTVESTQGTILCRFMP